MKIEKRSLASAPKLNEADASIQAGKRLVGYAARFNVESSILLEGDVNGGRPFVEMIARGAFARSLREKPDVRALFNHDTSAVLGRTKSGTLKLRETAEGLAYEVAIPDTSVGRDLIVMVARGDIDGCSFGFSVLKDKVDYRSGAPALRTLLDIELYEISTGVAFPAYPIGTSIAVHPGRSEKLPPRLHHAWLRFKLLDI